MRITAEPRSDQWNADDFIGGPRVFTIAGVREGKAEAKYDVDLVEGGGRCWRPPLTVLRLLMLAWGTDEAAEWVGRRVQLYRDPEVAFGSDKTGGIRVSAVSHISKPMTTRLTEKRGKKASVTVQPLPDAAPTADPTTTVLDAIAQSTSMGELKAAWDLAVRLGVTGHPDVVAAKEFRKTELGEAS